MSDDVDSDVTRSQVRRALQLMNQYNLYELEFEHKEQNRSLELSRSSDDSFPPLLEGRSSEVPGKLRSPAVGELQWHVSDGDKVSKGDHLATIRKNDAREEVNASKSGIISNPTEETFVEYGQHLGSVIDQSDEVFDEQDMDDEDE